jgi:hypothetical protein
VYGGYTTSKAEMVMIKVYDPEDATPKRIVSLFSRDCLRPILNFAPRDKL